VKYLEDLSRDGFGTVDTSKIDVVGNARVDEVKKPYPFGGGMLGSIYKEPPKTRYTDFEAPEVSIQEATLAGETLSVKLKVDPKTTKVDVLVDGTLAGRSNGALGRIECHLEPQLAEGAVDVAVHAYDRFLNCGLQTASLTRSGS
jgi:hypothetical protein